MITDIQIERRRLGRTDIEITPIGLGMMEFSGGGGLMGFAFPVIDQQEKNATVKAGLDGGINWFDTAELYGGGVSEKSLSTALKVAGVKDEEVVVATVCSSSFWHDDETSNSLLHSHWSANFGHCHLRILPAKSRACASVPCHGEP